MALSLTATEAHHAFDAAINMEKAFARKAAHARSSHEFDRAMALRWRWLDAATLAAQWHNPMQCEECLR